MEFFKQNTKIRFMGIRKFTYAFSIIIVVASLSSLIMNGLNFSLEFTGGTQLVLKYDKAANPQAIREELEQAGVTKAEVTNYGKDNFALVKLGVEKGVTSDAEGKPLKSKEIESFIEKNTSNTSAGKPTVLSLNSIGAQIGKQLAWKGALAVIVALILTMIYIAFRFEYRFAMSSTLALIHDPLLILGIFAYFQIEFDLTALAAVLTVIGYSLNDTIVVFDRVRENFRKLRKGQPQEILDLSINQTLSRTVMTSGLTLIAVVALFVMGGPVVHSFSLAMIVGIIIGTYSSIYVAGALALDLGLSRKDLIPAPRKETDDRP